MPRSTPKARWCAAAIRLASACLAVAGGIIGSARAAEPAAPTATFPTAVAARLERTATTTRLTFDLSGRVAATATMLESPDRVIVDLPQTNFQIEPAVGHLKQAAGGLINSFRFGLFAPGRSRIVIDLAAPATVVRVTDTPIAAGDPSRLVIELAKSDRVAFHKAALAAAPAAPTPLPAPVAADHAKAASLPVIVIDAGHGGIDPGANGNGVIEKDVVLDFATMLAAKLNATGAYSVVMTRKDDTFISLGDRVKVAREADAALFVSIHADSLTSDAAVTGSTIYIASKKASDAEAARVAQAENQSDQVAGVESAPEAAGVDDILFDLARRETTTYSHLFQRTLVGYWEKIAHLNHNPERAAGFRVLQAPDVPSVLLELGYLSSGKDVQNLTSPDWRDHATTAIVHAIDAFFAPRRAAQQAAAGTAVQSAQAFEGPAAPTGVLGPPN